MIISIVIGLVVFLVGLAIFELGMDALDEPDYFFTVAGVFMLLFAVGSVSLYLLLPQDLGPAKMASISPASLADRFAKIGYEETMDGEVIVYTPVASN